MDISADFKAIALCTALFSAGATMAQGPGDPIGCIGVGALKKPSGIMPLVSNADRARGAGLKTATDVFANLTSWVGQEGKKVYAAINTSRSNVKGGVAWSPKPEGLAAVAFTPIETPCLAIEELEIAHEGLTRQQSMVRAGQTTTEVVSRNGSVVGAMALLTGKPMVGMSFAAAVQAVSGQKRIDPRHFNIIGDTGMACNLEWFAKDPNLMFIPKGVSEKPRVIFAFGTANGVNWMVVGNAMPVSPEKAKNGYLPFKNDLGVKLGGTPFAAFASAMVVGEFDIVKAMPIMLKHSSEMGGCWFGVKEKGVQIIGPTGDALRMQRG